MNPLIRWLALTGLVLLGVLALVLLPRSGQASAIRAGEINFITEGETPAIRSFYGYHTVAERDDTSSFRWTDGDGTLIFRNGRHFGTNLLLELRLCSCRPGGQAANRVTISVDGTPLADVTGVARAARWRSYKLLLPPTAPAYRPDLLVAVQSDAVAHPTFGYPLGVRFDLARLAALGSSPAYTPLAAAWLALLALGVGVVLPQRSGVARCATTLAGLGLALAQGYLYQAQPLLAAWLATGLIVALALGLLVGHGPIVARLTGSRAPTTHQQRGLGGGNAAPRWRMRYLGAAEPLLNPHPMMGVLITILLVWLVVAPQVLGFWMLDDAYISFRYALNALRGHGLVFNPGERVEGYTNFLWTVLFVPLLAGGFDAARASQGLTLLLALVIAALTWRAAWRLAGGWAALGGLALLVCSAPFVLYTSRGSGMETALFALLVLAGALAYLGRTSGWLAASGALFGLAAMARPEGVLLAGLTTLHALISQPGKPGAWLQVRNPLWRIPLAFLVIYAPYYLWRFSYYGYPLPNTFYAKVGATGAQAVRGLGYALDFATAQAPLLLVALLALLWQAVDLRALRVLRGKPEGVSEAASQRQAVSYLWLIVAGYSLYIIAVGGDHFPQFRFFVPLLAPVALLATLGLRALASYRLGVVGLLLCGLGIGWNIPQLWDSRTLNPASQVWVEHSVVEKNREIGLWLRASTPPDTLIATGIAGALPFYAERPVLDSLGLNDLHIAHLEVPTIGQGVAGAEKTDVTYVLDRRPAYIPFNSSGTFSGNPRFEAGYSQGLVRGPEGRWMGLFRRNDLPAPPGWQPAGR